MTEREADEAELILLQFVSLMVRYGVTPTQAMAFALVKIPAMYHGAYEPDAIVH